MLQDRITKIKSINEKYDLENNAYVSFSGGKDSTVLHYLLDEALPNNKIPRVYINTGIEYNSIIKFVKELAETDERIIIKSPKINIRDMLEKYGYPFKSKKHSHVLAIYQSNGMSRNPSVYLTQTGRYGCPQKLKYQFTEDFKLKVSEKCCYKLKKEPMHEFEVESGRTIFMSGMRADEGGARISLNCIYTDKDNSLRKFHPLLPVNEDFEKWFIDKINKRFADVYYPPYNFERTGCKGCPYSRNLQKDLETMSVFLPAERKQCEVIWKPVYDEYRRIGYRLKKEDEFKLFDF